MASALSKSGYKILNEVWYSNNNGSKRLDLLAIGNRLALAIEVKRMSSGSIEADIEKVEKFVPRQEVGVPFFKVVLAYSFLQGEPKRGMYSFQKGEPVALSVKRYKGEGKYWLRYWWSGPHYDKRPTVS